MSGLAVAINAGGNSSRMGTDKAFVPVLGKPMIEHMQEWVSGPGQQLWRHGRGRTAHRANVPHPF